MLHETIRELQARGHEITLVVERHSVSEYDGIKIQKYDSSKFATLLRNADLLLTHLSESLAVVREATRIKVPVAYIQHLNNDAIVHFLPRQVLLLANSQVMRERSRHKGPTYVLYPAIDPSRYETEPGESISLINLNENKGGSFFWELARTESHRSFCGVKGAYGSQIVHRNLPNVEVLEHGPNIRKAYARTRVLLLPSIDESWGRVSIEAAVSGIPTIALESPGVVEALGGTGLVLKRREITIWREAIATLDDPEVYACYSRAAKARAAELAPEPIIADFEKALETFVGSF